MTIVRSRTTEQYKALLKETLNEINENNAVSAFRTTKRAFLAACQALNIRRQTSIEDFHLVAMKLFRCLAFMWAFDSVKTTNMGYNADVQREDLANFIDKNLSVALACGLVKVLEIETMYKPSTEPWAFSNVTLFAEAQRVSKTVDLIFINDLENKIEKLLANVEALNRIGQGNLANCMGKLAAKITIELEDYLVHKDKTKLIAGLNSVRNDNTLIFPANTNQGWWSWLFFSSPSVVASTKKAYGELEEGILQLNKNLAPSP